MAFIDDPLFYLIAVPAVLIVGIGKGGFAGGLGMLAVPLLALVTSPIQAAGIMLPILCVMDVTGVKAWLRLWDRALMFRLLPPAVVGIIIGALTFRYVSEAFLEILIGAMASLFALRYWLGGRVRLGLSLPDRPACWLWSGMSGYTSFVAHAGGPPLMIYLLPKKLDKSVFVGTVTIYFAGVNYVKLIPYGLLGQLSAENLGTSLLLAPAAVVGVKLGVWMHDRVNAVLFNKLMYVFLFCAGLKLLWDGFSQVLF
ncbi:sulfite exporter TauE/SafE family protein [Pusillimonas sp.]|uniref:sulfite exporter TauE/SafE family protein n=1 Tax=Pusillimonas sp. TaxID=3040095 RepID=UPI0037CA26FD